MELWQIGDSLYAPKFHVVSQPNDWAKAIKKSTAQSELSERRLMQLEFWNQFKEFAAANKSFLKLRKSYPQHWYDISIGNSKSHLSLIIDSDNEQIRCEFYIPDSKAIFHSLLLNKDEIESQIKYELEWMELEGKKASRVRAVHNIDVNDNKNWPNCFQWLTEAAQNFQTVFAQQIKALKL